MFLETAAVFLIGLLIRIGIPLLLTAFIVWTLRRLDARWQSEVNRTTEIKAKRQVQIRPLHCWEIQHCAPSLRESCRAYKNSTVPCWQQFRNGNGELREMCLECEIFRNAPLSMAA
jgi:hypothetical protein